MVIALLQTGQTEALLDTAMQLSGLGVIVCRVTGHRSAFETLADVYHYPTQHFEHHRRQLTLVDRD
jgi:hypothetical protein